ncbi:hypothetical protein QYE76_006028 [Lolium multiflorum]|uniref:Retrotransposon gag domain-containing protein n=1 Tax=Lolium multiflorum TaxID=4521 RepID=A0AAD8W3Q2_LOLMU|nr:hypothetical protein QYE76_006028 [Lolium multiflorum]
MSVVEYRDRFLTLSRYAPDETDTNEKRKERFLNGLHDEMQTMLVNIPFATRPPVDSAIQMEGKLHQANENRKRRMMNQHGSSNTQKYRNNSSGGFTPRYNKPTAQTYRPNYANNNGGPPKPGSNNNNNHNTMTTITTQPHQQQQPCPNGNNNNPNPKDKSTINCYECGVVGHYSMSAPRSLPRLPPTPCTCSNQRRFAQEGTKTYNMTTTEAQEAPQAMPTAGARQYLISPASIQATSSLATGTSALAVDDNLASRQRRPSPEPQLAADPLLRRASTSLLPDDDDDVRPSDRHLIQPLTITGTVSVREEFKRDLLNRIQENTEGWENDKDRESGVSVINSAVHKSEKKPIEPEEQIKVEPAVAIIKDLVTENVEDGHIIFCEDASNIVSHPNKSRKASVPMLSVIIGDHCYYGLCDIGASISAIPYELYTEIMHEIGSCELEDIDVVIRLANRETISPIGIVRDVEVLWTLTTRLALDSFPRLKKLHGLLMSFVVNIGL